jgi:hypothetical protein
MRFPVIGDSSTIAAAGPAAANGLHHVAGAASMADGHGTVNSEQ